MESVCGKSSRSPQKSAAIAVFFGEADFCFVWRGCEWGHSHPRRTTLFATKENKTGICIPKKKHKKGGFLG